MLVLTRKSEQSVMVGGTIEVKVLGVKGDQVSLGFSAPREISIHRKEVYKAIQEENTQAVSRNRQSLEQLMGALGQQFFLRS